MTAGTCGMFLHVGHYAQNPSSLALSGFMATGGTVGLVLAFANVTMGSVRPQRAASPSTGSREQPD